MKEYTVGWRANVKAYQFNVLDPAAQLIVAQKYSAEEAKELWFSKDGKITFRIVDKDEL